MARFRVLNRAYALLNDLLDLPGSKVVGDIDLSTVFPVHDLQGVLEGSLGHLWFFGKVDGFAGANKQNVPLSPFTGSGWDNIYRDRTSAGASSIDSEESNAFLLGYGVHGDPQVNVQNVLIRYEFQYPGGTYIIPVSGLLNTNAFQQIMAAGENTFDHPLPSRHPEPVSDWSLAGYCETSGAAIVTYSTIWLELPKGLATVGSYS